MHHIIGKQIIDLHLSNAKEAFTLQHKVSQLFWQRIAPELEQIFDQIANEKEWIRIDRLEIDLGDISQEQLLQGHFLNDLKRQLQTALNKLEKEQPTKVQRVSISQSEFQQWLYFLENGFFESHQLIPEKDWETQLLDTIDKSPINMVLFKSAIQQNRALLDRLVLQHAAPFCQKLVEKITTTKQTSLIPFLKEWQQLLAKINQQFKHPTTPFYTARKVEIKFWQFILNTALSRTENLSWEWLIGAYIQNNFSNTVFKQSWQIAQPKAKQFPVFHQLVKANAFWESSQFSKIEIDSNRPSSYPPKTIDSIKKTTLSTSKSNHAITTNEPNTKTNDKNPINSNSLINQERMPPSIEQKEWHILAAGIVLIHPFISHFFKKIGLLKGNQFKSEAARHKAIQLLQYLATGAQHIPEYNLVLPKLLCGLPLNVPVDYLINITEAEQLEANNMLQAAIDHWGVLGKASPDGLREGFLKRSGKLSHLPTGWKLQIEQQTMDILLDRLPWGISILKLPWMEELIKVEWR